MTHTSSHIKRVIIAGGGTGGHIFPALAIARALQRLQPDTEILFVGAKGKMEMEKVPQAGYAIQGLDIAGMDRGNKLKNISLPIKLVKSLIQARNILNAFRPDLALGVGGYASFPVLYMAQRRGIATMIQEQNSQAGKANQFLGRRARKICVAYEHMEKFFPANRIIVTGNPVREELSRQLPDKKAARVSLGLDPDRKTLFAFGGSLGALSINQAIAKHLDALLSEGIQVLWQTGKSFIGQATSLKHDKGPRVQVHAFIQDMAAAYAAADIVVCRSGALTIAELCIVGKPVIFVPYPYASEDHQTKNALALVQHDAALMVRNADVDTDLIPKCLNLINDETMKEILTENIRKFGIPDADIRIAREIISCR